MLAFGDTVLTAVVAFASTNIDDIFVLMLFYGQLSPTFRRRHVVAGQYLGFLALVAISALGYFGTLVIPREWIGLLGLAPIALGVRKLVRGREEAGGVPAAAAPAPPLGRPLLGALFSPQTYTVAAVTFANGGDNIGIYVPLFARGSGVDLVVTVAVFLLLVAVWCWLAAVLAGHPRVARLLDAYGHRIVPFVLIGLGLLILLESGALGLVGLGQ